MMKNKTVIILCLLLLMLSFSACSEIKKNNKSNAVTLGQSAVTVTYGSKEVSENDTQYGTNDADVKNKKTEDPQNSQNSAYTADRSENNTFAEVPPTPSAKETDEDTTAADIVSEDSDGWINKWY